MRLQDPTSSRRDEETFPSAITVAKRRQGGGPGTVNLWINGALAVLPLFIITRLVFLLLTYFGVVLFTVPNYSSDTLSANALFYSWYRWDAVRFATIAATGYKSLEYTAFFPLYPWLERIISIPLHHDVYLAGMLISNLASACLLVVLYRFVEREFDRDTATRTILYLATFPTAFFFFAAYNESLFLLFVLLSYYAMRQGSWWLAGLFGCLATLTRSAGLALIGIFLYEFMHQSFSRKQRRSLLRTSSDALAIFLIPLGFGIYSFYLNQLFQDPLAFLHAQAHWRLGLNPPWYALLLSVKNITTFSPYTFVSVHTIIDLLAFLLFFILLILCFVGPERLPTSQWSLPLLGLLMVLLPLLFPSPYLSPLASMERFVLELFAGFILLARLGRRPWFHQGYLLLTLPFLAFLLLQFITDHWTV